MNSINLPQNNFIINPEQISPLIKASEDRIQALEEEVNIYYFYFFSHCRCMLEKEK